jgi:hypothetical protein
MEETQFLAAASKLSQTLSPGDLDHTLRRITTAAVAVLPGVTHASITIAHSDGRLETVAPTNDVLCDLDAAQYDLQEGPCYDAATDEVHVTAPHLAADDRFPRYRTVASNAGIKAQAGVRLFDAPDSKGALNLYSSQEGAFEDLGFLGALFQHQSAIAIAYAHEVVSLRDAIETRQMIGQAVGIVMERYGLSEQRAFAFLARLSQDSNIKLRVLAQKLIQASDEKLAHGAPAAS